jgi:hypothetical protein
LALPREKRLHNFVLLTLPRENRTLTFCFIESAQREQKLYSFVFIGSAQREETLQFLIYWVCPREKRLCIIQIFGTLFFGLNREPIHG